MGEIILHHYPESPFSEKVRLALGLKGLAWRSVHIPNMMPKPDLMPLTGGYRRTPVMQVGADIYCDTQCIVRALERMHPEPTLYPGGSDGIAHALLFFTDRPLFMAAVQVIFGATADFVPQEFYEDRSKLMGGTFDAATLKAAAPLGRDQLESHLDLLERILADGRSYLLGEAPGLADFNAYHVVWFLKNIPPVAEVLEPHGRLRAWMDRIASIGHGTPEPTDAKEALEIAAAAEPMLDGEVFEDPSGRRAGDRVQVMPEDYGRDPVVGEIVALTPHEIAIRREVERLGTLVLHFPRAGFIVLPA